MVSHHTHSRAARSRLVSAAISLGILAATGIVGAPPAGADVPVVKVVGSTSTVRPTSGIPAHATDGAAISAARNEFESFQVIVQAPVDQALDDVRLDVSIPLESADADLPSTNVTFYREHFYNAAQQSDLEGGAGYWPDALIPERDYFYDENRAAFPVDIAAGGRMVAWIDIYVPEDQPAGDYFGVLEVTTGSGENVPLVDDVTVNLKVHDFEIPSTSSLSSVFPIQAAQQPCVAHTGSGNCGGDAQMRWRLHSLYARAALENRVTISNPWPLGQDSGPPTGPAENSYFNQYVRPLVRGLSPADASLSSPLEPVRLDGAKLTALHFYSYRDWHCINTCPDAWKAFAADPNDDGSDNDSFSGRLYNYACDEPGNSGAAWATCANYGLTSDDGIRKLVTAMAPHAANAGYLDEIDALVPIVNYMVGKDCCGSPFVGNQRDEAVLTDWLDASSRHEVWLYTSNMSYGSDEVSAATIWEGWPGYAIDAPPLQARAMGWLAFAYRTTGELYYDTTTKLHTAWTNLYEAGGNGDGTMFYPGVPDGRGVPGDANYAPAIGGTNPIPIESIRMKRIRDAREDYEYLQLLTEQGDRSYGMNRFEELFVDPNTDVFDMDTAMFSITGSSTTLTEANLQQARLELAAQIDGSAPVGDPFKADALIKRKGDYPTKGGNVYNTTGDQQTVKLGVPSGETRTFVLKIENDGEEDDSFSVVGSKPAGFVTKYYSGTTNVTSDVVGGLYSTGVLAPGASHKLQMTVKPRFGTAAGTVREWKVHGVSYQAQVQLAQNVRDVVGLKATVK